MSALRGIKLAVAVALALAALPGCQQQDAALRVDVSGPFRMAVDADTLVVDVLDWPSKVTIDHHSFPLTPSTAWPTSIVLVQSGAAHPSVKIHVTLYQSNRLVGRGVVGADDAVDFADGTTTDVTVPVLPQ